MAATTTKTRAFRPNSKTFDEGLADLKSVIGNRLPNDQILTSRDSDVIALRPELETLNVPGGFEKHQLPFYFEGGPGAQFFLTTAQAGAVAPRHAHHEGDGVRFIIAGSIEYGGTTLSAGDWMYVPAGAAYEFSVGEEGAVMAYCYRCCCA